MSLDVAYSIELNEYIDPDRAYDLYWSGLITNKKLFICPGEDCSAQVTCANLDEDMQNMRVVPHYRIYGKHHPNCEIERKVPLKILSVIENAKQGEKKTLDQSIVDSFILHRPDSYYESKKKDDNKNHGNKQNKYLSKSYALNLKEIGNIGKVYSVRTIVSRYIRYIKDNTLINRKLNISGMDIPYSGVFKCIWEQKIDSLPEYGIIYYGWAYIDKYEGKGYRIKFKKKIKNSHGELLQTTCFISQKLIDKYHVKKLVIKRLSKIIQTQKSTAFVFIYGRPEIIRSKINNKEYVNFYVDNLDYIDINVDNPLPKRKV
ncbi:MULTISPECIES: hypothetical protein [Photorhabdus]|uniref:Uncharacterized protein n=3 Tax=Photorhabdus TaxID=29487 RepID=A0A329VIG5_9GAMM|nr:MULTISPECIES: hypothetical protein [Photorhabdus]PQQ29211.1 hypothetical protein C6H66_02780 [Photorhabdus hindustanensis]RAW91589.1 hypothetical protein CKY01_08565 [Photorhabdus laumondii subsp. clarkei]